MKIIDLTHTLASDIPSWGGSCTFRLSSVVDYKDCVEPNLFRVQRIETKAGEGTHMDAPAHCVPGGKTIDALGLDDLITSCVVIRVDSKADENYVAMPDVVEKFEKEYGKIPPNAFVLFYTGWGKYWDIPEKYRNDLKFPSIHGTTAKLLLERSIAGVGIDTMSTDARGEDFPVHRAILGAGKYLIENVARAGELPAIGARIMVMPTKIKDATEAPIRLVAMVD